MPSVNPLLSATSGTPAANTQTAGGILGKDDFLRLLVGQLQHQDPLNPTADGEFIAQMAQFSTVEQLANLSKAQEAMTLAQSAATANGLIGRTVAYENAEGATVTGTVERVSHTAEGPRLVVDGVEGIELARVREVT